MKGVWGEDSSENIIFENGYSFTIEYKNRNLSLNRSRYTGKCRVIRLYDENGNLISELLEDNPHYNENELRIKKYRHDHYGFPMKKRERFPDFLYYQREGRLRRSSPEKRLELIEYHKNRNPEDYERYIRWCKHIERVTGKKCIY